ncbi:MAG TPA: tetratricopeptide repeat protein, partial [Planctomycetota bacterium]|nr:tetratricopeptide repeat protein [Planctomycetota bacterium]
YQCLGGELPFPSSRYTLPEMLRAIAEEEPDPLSSLEPACRGDLETIVAKAMDKEPRRRYDSAAELAADLRRYLKDLPIVARPATARYQLSKFARRNRGLVGALVALLVALVLGLTGTLWGMSRAQKAAAAQTIEAQNAVKAFEAEAAQRKLAVEAEQRAVEARKLAEAKEQVAAAVRGFVEELLGSPGGKGVEGFYGPQTRVVDVLGGSYSRLRERFAGQPEVEFALQALVGQTYLGLDQSALALPFLERACELALELEGPDSQTFLGVDWSRRLAQGFGEFSAEARAELNQQIDRIASSFGVDSKFTHTCRRQASEALTIAGSFQEALEGFEQLIADLAPTPELDPENLFQARLGRARTFGYMGRVDEGVAELESALSEVESRYGADSLQATLVWMDLGGAYLRSRQFDKAKPFLEKTRAFFRGTQLENSAPVAQSLGELGQLYMAEGKPDEAIEAMEQSYQILKKVLEPTDIRVSDAAVGLSLVLTQAQRFDEAMHWLDLVDEQYQKDWPASHRMVCDLRVRQSYVELMRGNPERCLEILQKQTDVVLADPNASLNSRVFMQEQLARSLSQIPDYEQALPLYKAVYEGKREDLGHAARETLLALYQYGRCLEVCNQADVAQAALETAFGEFEGTGENGGARAVAGFLAEFFRRQGDQDAANQWATRAGAQ